ncbi:MAG: UbiA family prenyltransferase [Verrucomicrobiales bacterium]|nr:UbiA family prenyltransferase [Verrucomicrobiales bacterium]
MKESSILRTLLILGRISNLPTIWTNVAVGWFLSGGVWNIELLWILAGMSLLYLAGMTLNDAFDAGWDKENAPDRPIAAGHISVTAVWAVGSIQMIAGAALLFLFTGVQPFLIGGLILAILLYNWLHKRWAGSVIIMGICRSLVYLGAGSAVVTNTAGIEMPEPVYIVAFGVVLYIAGLTLAARSEHLKTPRGLPFGARIMLMIPVLFPLFGSRLLAPEPNPAKIALIVVGVFGVWSWLVIMLKALHEKVPKGIAFAIAGIAFYDASIVAFANWQAAVACLACFGLTLVAQRFIPAT